MRRIACSMAYSVTRWTPARVNTDSWMAASSRRPRRTPATDLGVLALDVLADHHEVDPVGVGEWGGDPGRIRIGRRFTYWSNSRRMGISRPQSVTSSGMSCSTYGAEEGGVAGGELVDAVNRHHSLVAAVVVRPPVPVAPFGAEAEGGGEGVDAGDSGGHDLGADAVARDDVDGVRVAAAHLAVPVLSRSTASMRVSAGSGRRCTWSPGTPRCRDVRPRGRDRTA